MPDDPLRLFQDLFERAQAAESGDATAGALATADASGRPSVRMVLLKGVDAEGFVFFTNYESRKARELQVNPWAALCFHWPSLGSQVRAEGQVERVSGPESDAYFATRPRGSQLAAWASRQSEVLASREELLARYKEAEARFAEVPVPRPPFWGGYRLRPDRIEFWQSEEMRLHRRLCYLREGGAWRTQALQP
jgi:pyridoxamine 5'-phosphate oxidase